MSYKDLPEDFRNNYLKNLLFEFYFYSKITKQFNKEDYYINIYKYQTRDGKHTIDHTLKYNTMISSYEINTTRYLNYEQAFNAMWDLERNPPL
jgi:hypothetical protein